MAVSDAGTASLRSISGVRIAAVCGVLWPVLAMIRLFLTGEFDRPDWTASQSAIVDFYEGSSFDGAFMVGIALVVLAYLLLLVFIAKVAAVVRDHPDGAPWLGYAILGLNVAAVAFTVGYLAPFVTAVFWASNGGLSGDAYLVLHGLSYASYWFALPTDLLASFALGGAIVMTRLFPRWLGWAMILTGIAEATTWFMSPPAWNASSGLPYLWILIAAVIMVARPGRYVSSRAPA